MDGTVFKENASSLDICVLFVKLWKEDLERTCGNVSTIPWKANDKSFYVTSPPGIDKHQSLD